MTANPQDFAYFLRGELPKPTKGSNNTTGFDHFNRGEIFPAAIPNAVTGTASATLGALTATATGTPKVSGTASANLGALSASATGTPKVTGTASATLGSLTVTAAGTVTGGSTPTTIAPTGGNLTKPRLHLGNSPGRKELAADGQLLYTLTLTGYGELGTPGVYSLPTFSGEGEIIAAAEMILRLDAQAAGSVTANARLDVNTARRGVGTCSEDADDLLVLLSL